MVKPYAPTIPDVITRLIVLLFAGCGALSGQAQPSLTVVASSPSRNAVAVRRPGPLAITFSRPLDAATVSTASVPVFSAQRGGHLTGAFTGTNTATVGFQPSQGFKPGETVVVSLTPTLRAAGVALTRPEVYQFTTETAPATAAFPGFTGAVFSNVQGNTAGVVAADLNGDGLLDLAAADRLGGVDVAIGDGTGRFTGAYLAASGGAYTAVTAADVNGDGTLELLAPKVRDNRVEIFMNAGTPGGLRSLPTAFVDPDARQVATADIDGDGDLDLLVTCFSGTVAVRFNNGQGSFSRTGSVAVPSAYGIAAGDIDNDGDVDFLATNYNAGRVAVFRNNGTGTFTAGLPVVTGTSPIRVSLGDVNGDGALDACVSNLDSNTLSVALNNGAGTFSTPTAVPAPHPADLALGDLDGDGDLDLAVADYSYGVGISVRLNDGLGNFSGTGNAAVAGNMSGQANEYPFGVALADLDGNGTLDILSSTFSGIASARLNSFVPALLSSSSPTVCQGTNGGILTLTRRYGTVVKYQADTGTGFVDVPGTNTGPTLSFANLTVSTTYRAVLLTPEGRTVVSAPVTVTVQPLPVVTVSANGPTRFCQGDFVRLTANAGTGASYTWSTGATAAAITVAASGTYSVTATSSTGCAVTSAPTVVTVVPTATAAVAYSAAAFCQTSPAVVPTVSGTAGGAFFSTTGLALDATTGRLDPRASQPGRYTVVYQFGSSCPGVASAAVTITAPPAASFAYPVASYCTCSPAAPAPVLAPGTTAGFFASTAGLALDATTGVITASASLPGTYTVTNTVAAAGGCAAVTATCQVLITAAVTATLPPSPLPFFTLWPNPTAEHRVTLLLSGYRYPVGVRVYNMLGAEVYQTTIPDGGNQQTSYSLLLPVLAPGAYTLRTDANGMVVSQRFVRLGP